MSKPLHAEPKQVENYRIGPGDVLRIIVFQNPELTLETRVAENGSISYPLIGELAVEGMTSRQIEINLAKLLSDKNFIKSPQVNVFINQYRSSQISVLGLVNRPGKYPLDLPYRLTDILAIAGGVAQGGADQVILSRFQNGKLANIEIDLISMFTNNGNRSLDFPLQHGDVLYVHRAPVFYIYGEVQRPGTYRLERDMFVRQALSASGGLTAKGSTRGIKVFRRNKQGETVQIELSLDAQIAPDDVIQIKESLF